MASRTAGFTFTRTKYPWKEWADGSQWRILKGEDYKISTYNMQISLHGRARLEGLKVKTHSFTEHSQGENGWVQTVEGLVFQFSLADKQGAPHGA